DPGRIFGVPRAIDDEHPVAVRLIGDHQGIAAGAQPVRDAAAILDHRVAVVARAQAAVERAVDVVADAAIPGEEPVAYARTVREQIDGDQGASSSVAGPDPAAPNLSERALTAPGSSASGPSKPAGFVRPG